MSYSNCDDYDGGCYEDYFGSFNEATQSNESQQYVVICEDNHECEAVCVTLESAEKTAEKLAKDNSNKTFLVCVVKARYRTKVVREEVE